MTGNDADCSEKEEVAGEVQYGNPTATDPITHKCKKKMAAKDQYGNVKTMTLSGFIIVPGLTRTLLSVSKLYEVGCMVSLDPKNMVLGMPAVQGRRIFFPIVWKDNMLAVELEPLNK